jgi:hypothetical protein
MSGDIAVGIRGIPERTENKQVLYGVLVDDGGKKPSLYICTYMIKNEGFVDIKGFKTDHTVDSLPDLNGLYNLVGSIDRSIVQEISFYGSRVCSIRTLTYRAK